MILFYFKETFNSIRRAKFSSFISFTFTLIAIIFVSISVVFVGLSEKLDTKLKNNIGVSVYLVDKLSSQNVNDIKIQIEKEVFVRSVKLISKDEAKRNFIEETGNDFSHILDVNPLPVSLNVKFYANNLNEINLRNFITKVNMITGVEDVVYENSSTFQILNFINKSKYAVYIVSVILFILAIYLIYSMSILIIKNKLNQYETMKLVGTKLSAIKLPIYMSGIIIGVLASICSTFVFTAIIYIVKKLYPAVQFGNITDLIIYFELFLGVYFGIMGPFFSTKKISLKINKF